MLTFQVAKSNFPAERGSGVALKCWVKKAKCQVVMGGFTAMQMEREEFHVLLLISFLHLTENQFKNLCPQIDEICHMWRERLLWPQ